MAGKLSLAEKDLQSVLRTAPDDYRRPRSIRGRPRTPATRARGRRAFLARHSAKDRFRAGARSPRLALCAERPPRRKPFPNCGKALQMDPSRRDASDALVRLLQENARAAVESRDYPKALPFLTEAEKTCAGQSPSSIRVGNGRVANVLVEDASQPFKEF